MKKVILSIMMLVGVWWLGTAAHHAYADCIETPGGSGNWECPSNDTNGVSLGGGNDTVTIADGVTVSNAGDAIFSTGNVTIDSNNTGNISTTGNNAVGIYANGDVTYSGNGSISTTGDTGDGILGTGNVSYSGSGSISTTGDGADGIIANGDVTYSGNGSISTTGDYADGIDASGNVTYSGNGSISTTGDTGVGIYANGDVTYSGNGSISTTGDGAAHGIIVNGNATISGNGSISTTGIDAYGIIAVGNVNYSGGTIKAANSSGISGFSGTQIFTFTGGTITGGNGTAIDARVGNDTVSLTVSSVTLTGRIDGNTDTDTLELNGTTDDQAGWDFFQNCMTTPAACSGAGPFTVNANGQSFVFTNFEAFINNMTLIITSAGGQPISIAIGGDSAPAQTTSQPLCDGAVKIFRQPNGDLDVYSGFDALPPNGFMVGRVTVGELAAGILRYQDPGIAAQQGWVVEVTRTDKLIIQVFDGQGNPIGSCNL